MAKPTYTPPPNEAPVLGDPQFAAKAQGFLGWFPVMGEYMQGMGEWIETMIGDVPSDNIAAFAHLNGAANKLPYFTGAGAMAMADLTTQGRSLIGQSSFGINTNGLAYGTAVTQSSMDETNARLLKVGDFGIGRGMVEFYGNFDDPPSVPSGLYLVNGAATGRYPGGLSSFAMLQMRRGTTPGINTTQLAFGVYSGEMYSRSYRSNGVWSDWISYEVTRGSNSNGDYVRFPDGTQICSIRKSSASDAWVNPNGMVYQGDQATWTYPAAFAAVPTSISGATEVGSPSGVSFSGVTSTSMRWTPWCTNQQATGTGKNVFLTATGRWR